MPAQRKCRRDSARHSPNPTITRPPAMATTRVASTDREPLDQPGHGEHRQRVAGGDRRQRRAAPPAPTAFLQPDRHGEQPAHARVEAVERAEPGERRDFQPTHGKQYESDDASPPCSRVWCTRRPRNSSPCGKNRASRVEAAVVQVDVELGHPGADAVRVELVVPRAVERVGDVDPAAVAGLTSTICGPPAQRLVRRGRVRGPRDDAAEPHLAGQQRRGTGRTRRTAAACRCPTRRRRGSGRRPTGRCR